MKANVGDRGQATSPLYPSGRVVIDGVSLLALAVDAPLEQGTEIIVVGGDRFSLFVRQFDPSQPSATLSGHGTPVLTGKDEALQQGARLAEQRQKELEEDRRIFFWLMFIAADLGFFAGIALVVWQSYRTGFRSDLLLLPVLSSASWFCVVGLAFYLGAATETILVFTSIPAAAIGLAAGMVLWGPFAAVVCGFLLGMVVCVTCLGIEALRHPAQ